MSPDDPLTPAGRGGFGEFNGFSVRHYCTQRLLFKWLNRRSQKRSLNWKQFSTYIRRWLPKARILHDLYPVPWWKTQAGSRMV